MSDIEARLDNWGNVMRWRKRNGNGSTGSIEGGYRSPQHWEPWGIATPSDIALGWKDAEDVELAATCLPDRYHALLRASYVYRASPNAMMRLARKIGFVRPDMAVVEAAVAMGKALMVKELAVPAEARRLYVRAAALQTVQKGIDYALFVD